jgi:hypothetical protein
MEPISHENGCSLSADSRLEDLALSVRTRNALKGVGCNTIADVLRLDLGTPIRGLGKIAREELLVKLERAGFAHPADAQPGNELTRLEQNLDRMQQRVDFALGAVSKEIRAARQRLRKLRIRAPQPDPVPPADRAR